MLLLHRLCQVRGQKKALHSEEPWAITHRCVKVIYDLKTSKGIKGLLLVYGCIGSCQPEFWGSMAGMKKTMFLRCFFFLKKVDFKSMFRQDYLHFLSERRDQRTASHFLDAIVGSVPYVPFSPLERRNTWKLILKGAFATTLAVRPPSLHSKF